MTKKQLRQKEIISKLEIQESLTVDEIAASFGITEATIRRDLEELERDGKLVRTHGGARIIQEDPATAKTFKERANKMLQEKMAVVHEIERLIPDEAVITLDNGTTAWLLAKKLKNKKGLTVVTNSVLIMEELYETEGIKLMLTGGTFRKRNYDFIGEKAVTFLKEIYSDIAILTCDSIRPGKGFYKMSEASAEIAKASIESSNKVYVVSDHSKIDAEGSYRFLTPEHVDRLFIDNNCSNENKELLNHDSYEITYCM